MEQLSGYIPTLLKKEDSKNIGAHRTENSIIDREASPEHYFILSDGQKIKSLLHLRQIMLTMDKSVFAHYVTEHKNDFSNWIRSTLMLPELAREVRTAKTREKLSEVLETFVKAHSKLKQAKYAKMHATLLKQENKKHIPSESRFHEKEHVEHKTSEALRALEKDIEAKLLSKEQALLKREKEVSETKKELEALERQLNKLNDDLELISKHQDEREKILTTTQHELETALKDFQHEEDNVKKLEQKLENEKSLVESEKNNLEKAAEEHSAKTREFRFQEQKLEDFEKQLIEKEKELASREKKLSYSERSVKGRATRLDAYEKQVSKNAVHLQLEIMAFENTKLEVKKKYAEFKKGQWALKRLERRLMLKNEQLIKEKAELGQRQVDMGQVESYLKLKEQDHNTKFFQIQKAHDELKKIYSKLMQKEKKLSLRETKLVKKNLSK